MAFIKCPVCNQKVSDEIANCPDCGCPTGTETEAVENTERKGRFNVATFLRKNWWLWVVLGVLILALAATYFICWREVATEPKLDKDGNPVFISLTTRVYQNAEDYLGYTLKVNGQITTIISESKTEKLAEISLDPGKYQKNLVVSFAGDADIAEQDYIELVGYIDSLSQQLNWKEEDWFVPLVKATGFKKSTYQEIVAPTVATLLPQNAVCTIDDYSITVDKVEFAETETRVYITSATNGKETICFDDATMIQSEEDHSLYCYDRISANIPYENSDVLLFPAAAVNNFTLKIDTVSGKTNVSRSFDFLIEKEKSEMQDHGYRAVLQEKIDFDNGISTNVDNLLPEAVWNYVAINARETRAAVKDALKFWCVDCCDEKVNFIDIKKEIRLSPEELAAYQDGLNVRYEGLNLTTITDGYELIVEVTKANGEIKMSYPTMIQIDGKWYWSEKDDATYPYFHTGCYTPAA